jgi:hypothetical protein
MPGRCSNMDRKYLLNRYKNNTCSSFRNTHLFEMFRSNQWFFFSTKFCHFLDQTNWEKFAAFFLSVNLTNHFFFQELKKIKKIVSKN